MSSVITLVIMVELGILGFKAVVSNWQPSALTKWVCIINEFMAGRTVSACDHCLQYSPSSFLSHSDQYKLYLFYNYF